MKLPHDKIIFEAKKQLAIDLNCTIDNFDREGFVFCEAKENPGRRPFPRGERHFEMYSMGKSVIVSATADILPYIQGQLHTHTTNTNDAFNMPFVYGAGLYFLPYNLSPLPFADGFTFESVEREDIPILYAFDGFKHAIQYDINHPRPDALAMTAKKDGKIVGIAGSSNDCEMLWQIGIDVLPEYQGKGLASILTGHLAIEIIKRGRIPYYGTALANVASQRVAHRAGFQIAWVCAYRGVFDGILTSPTG